MTTTLRPMGQFRFLFSAADYDATVRFYTDTMNLPIVHQWDDHGRGTIVAASGTGQVEIFEADDAATVTGAALAWEVEDVDAEHARLVRSGVSFLAPPADQPWGHRNATLQAPDGVVITLFTVTGDES